MITLNALISVLIILGFSLVMAQSDICSSYGQDANLPGASCADIYNKNPTSHGRSGYYVLKTDHLFFAYCDMELDCGGNKGGWMRIADIDTSRGDACPSGWNNYNSYCTGGLSAGCHSAYFSTNSTSYSKVCGKVVGYQKGNMDAFYPSAYSTSRSLDGVYVDGISITYGNPRKHVWTYAVGANEDSDYIYSNYTCPCANYSGPDPPVYIGSHYYCESSLNREKSDTNELFYTDDPLWDGAGCPSENNCCSYAGLPWFFRQFPTTTTGNIEVRICHDEQFSNEGVGIEQIQLYVQ